MNYVLANKYIDGIISPEHLSYMPLPHKFLRLAGYFLQIKAVGTKVKVTVVE